MGSLLLRSSLKKMPLLFFSNDFNDFPWQAFTTWTPINEQRQFLKHFMIHNSQKIFKPCKTLTKYDRYNINLDYVYQEDNKLQNFIWVRSILEIKKKKLHFFPNSVTKSNKLSQIRAKFFITCQKIITQKAIMSGFTWLL